MPKNYGAGVAGSAARAGGLRSFVRLGRRELWLRLDRNMIAGARPRPAGRVPARPSSSAELASRS